MKGTHCDDKNVEAAATFAVSGSRSCATDPNYLASRATSGVDNKYDTQKCIDHGEDRNSDDKKPDIPEDN